MEGSERGRKLPKSSHNTQVVFQHGDVHPLAPVIAKLIPVSVSVALHYSQGQGCEVGATLLPVPHCTAKQGTSPQRFASLEEPVGCYPEPDTFLLQQDL